VINGRSQDLGMKGGGGKAKKKNKNTNYNINIGNVKPNKKSTSDAIFQ